MCNIFLPVKLQGICTFQFEINYLCLHNFSICTQWVSNRPSVVIIPKLDTHIYRFIV